MDEVVDPAVTIKVSYLHHALASGCNKHAARTDVLTVTARLMLSEVCRLMRSASTNKVQVQAAHRNDVGVWAASTDHANTDGFILSAAHQTEFP